MPTLTREVPVERDAPVPTWFGVGGRADRLARPRTLAGLRACLAMDPDLLILGDGANLLVADEGVDRLVVSLGEPAFSRARFDASSGRVLAHAGANLPKVILESVRLGLSGLEGLGGIPATIGGATVMNAGGKFGEISGVVTRVHALRRGDAAGVEVSGEKIGFGYRASGLGDLIVYAVEMQLTPDDPARVRDRLKDVMAYKKESQPLKERSAGCAFRNPTLDGSIDGIGEAGSRVSAGLLIDRAGCKGLRQGGARVSDHHANFLVAERGSSAAEVERLMREVERRVFDAFGVRLVREIVVWSRRGNVA